MTTTYAVPFSVRTTPLPATWWAALAGLCIVLVAPLLVCDVPPLTDYPNHLARWFVLASLPRDLELAKFYTPHWSVIPNLALDVVAPPLMHLLPVHVAGRLLIGLCVLLPVLGAVAYNRALGGKWWGFGAGLLGYNSCLLYGFLNFSFSIGLALLLAAVWLRWRETRPVRTVAIAVAGALLLFACHLMGLVFFGFLIGGAELYRIYTMLPGFGLDASVTPPRHAGAGRHPRLRGGGQGVDGGPSAAMTGGDGGADRLTSVRVSSVQASFMRVGIISQRLRAILRRGSLLLLIFAAPAALYAVSDLQQLGGDAIFLPAGEKLFQIVTIFTNYDRVMDILVASIAIGLPVLCLAMRRGVVPGLAAVPMVLLWVTFLAAPFAWKGTYLLDTRLAVMLDFMVFAGFVPGRWPNGLSMGAIGTLAGLFAGRMALLTTVWAVHNADIADVRRALEPVQPGEAVYVASNAAPGNPRWRKLSNGVRTDVHLGALALIEHRAYWPFEFDNASQQPLETNEPYRTLATRIADLPDRDRTAAANVCGFGYVLLTGANAVPELPAERFRLLIQSGYAALYKVTRCQTAIHACGPPADRPGSACS